MDQFVEPYCCLITKLVVAMRLDFLCSKEYDFGCSKYQATELFLDVVVVFIKILFVPNDRWKECC